MQNKPKKSLGQNFLVDKNILDKIIKIGDINIDDHILEIGPGTGNLTKLLVKSNVKKITVIEKDNKLSDFLKRNLKDKVQIINADARSLFFDPLNPPKGSIPDKALSWNSICKGEVDGCLKPVLYADNPVKSAIIEQGKCVYRAGYIYFAVSQLHTPHSSHVMVQK